MGDGVVPGVWCGCRRCACIFFVCVCVLSSRLFGTPIHTSLHIFVVWAHQPAGRHTGVNSSVYIVMFCFPPVKCYGRQMMSCGVVSFRVLHFLFEVMLLM